MAILVGGCGGPGRGAVVDNNTSKPDVVDLTRKDNVTTPAPQVSKPAPPPTRQTSRPLTGRPGSGVSGSPLSAPDLTAPQAALTAREFLDRALTARPPEKQDLELKAASAFVQEGNAPEASRILSSINLTGMDVSFHFRRQLGYVEIEQSNGAHQRALSILGALSRQRSAPAEISAEILRLAASSQVETRQYLQAAATLSAREKFLTDPADQSTNATNLWNLLRLTDASAIAGARGSASDPTLRGWLELAEIDKRLANNPAELARALNDWQTRYVDHSGQQVTADLGRGAEVVTSTTPSPTFTDADGQSYQNYGDGEDGEDSLQQNNYGTATINVEGSGQPIRQIALLLPMGSRFGNAAKAVFDGFMAMHNVNNRADRPRVVLYDIGADAWQASDFYQTAVAEGADFIVGPLGREAVDALVDSGLISRPTLMLGVSQLVGSISGPVYQFGLLPEDDASAMAQRAFAEGHRVAAVITPEGALGQRMQAALINEWRSAGGSIGSAVSYATSQAGYSQAAKRLLDVDASQSRGRRLGVITGKDIEFEPRRRQDLDVVLMMANSAVGRQLKPQIDFHQGHDLSVFASSHIHNGKSDPINDADLDGVIFPDMPWIIDKSPQFTALRQRFGNAGGGRPARMDRLFAFGMDAYSIVPNLQALASNPLARFDGVTARLGIDNLKRVTRQSSWARFADGTVQAIGRTQ